jgi:hypothetical protein
LLTTPLVLALVLSPYVLSEYLYLHL